MQQSCSNKRGISFHILFLGKMVTKWVKISVQDSSKFIFTTLPGHALWWASFDQSSSCGAMEEVRLQLTPSRGYACCSWSSWAHRSFFFWSRSSGVRSGKSATRSRREGSNLIFVHLVLQFLLTKSTGWQIRLFPRFRRHQNKSLVYDMLILYALVASRAP